MSTSVFVSGATGFIAQHIIKLLISKGYKVVGSVRGSSKGEHLQTLFGTENFAYEIVPDISQPGAFDEALKRHPEITVFLHTASPVTFTVNDVEKELLQPAVEGTKNALRAIKAHAPQITNVVVTSSTVSALDFTRILDPGYIITESSWSPVTWDESRANATMGYFGSKKFAELAAWEFLEQESPNFALNVVIPSYVFGPQAFDPEATNQLNFSSELVNGFLGLGPNSEYPSHDNVFIDVRDVARAHVEAFEKGLVGQRLLLSSGHFDSQKILDILNGSFDSLKGKIPSGNPGVAATGQRDFVDNRKTRGLLGYTFADLKTSVFEAAAQIMRVKSALA